MQTDRNGDASLQGKPPAVHGCVLSQGYRAAEVKRSIRNA
jgi:hypothetical protein